MRGEARTPARRRLDALSDICRHWLEHPDTARAGRTGRHRAQLIVTLDHHGPRDPAVDTAAPGAAHPATSPGDRLTWAGPITAATARRLACDSQATFVTLGPDGSVAQVGTKRRFFTTGQCRAMVARDGDTCPAPFCDRPVAWPDGPHLVPVDHGGPATVANGALPCQVHHLMLHEGHWTLDRLPDGRHQLHHQPTGKTAGPEPPRPGHNRPPPA